MNPEDYYSYTIKWSEEDKEFVCLCKAFPYLSCLDPDPYRALQDMRGLIADVINDMIINGEVIPIED